MTVTVGGLAPSTNQKRQFWDAFGMPKEAEHFPYVIQEEDIPVTNTLTVVLPKVLVQFYGKQVEVPSYTYVATPSTITDIWVSPEDGYIFHSVGLSEYGSLPRYDEYVHYVRLQASSTKVQGFYLRRPSYSVSKLPAPRSLDYSDIANDYVIPNTYVTWADNSAVTQDTIYLSLLGDMWKCTVAGVCAGGLPSPTYSEDSNSGFAIVVSGSASFKFMGRASYKDAWKVSPKAGIQWYFASIAAGLLVDQLPNQVLAFIKAMAFHCVNDWISGVPYTIGRKVGGLNTQGRVWEATTEGTTTGIVPFPINSVIGSTCNDGTIIWKCVGVFAHSNQKFFWYDTEPTQKLLRSPDSHDSYAACFVWVVQKYLTQTNNVSWLSELSPHNGLTYDGFIREVIYSNLLTQITSNNLTNTFQNTGVPSGGNYDANFLMDNCEVWAGLKSAQIIYTSFANDVGYANYIGIFADQVLNGLAALWEPATNTFKYVHGLASMVPPVQGKSLFYPLVMSQAWPTLWGVPLEPNKKQLVFEYMASNYDKWWARNDTDDLLACGAHYALTLVNRSRLVKDEVITRIEVERLPVGQADLYIHDAAYYLVMRDSVRTPTMM